MSVCEQCGKEHEGNFGSGRFCSRSCSNKWVALNQSPEAKARKVEKGKGNLKKDNWLGRSHTEETRKKISDSVRKVMDDPLMRKRVSSYSKGRILSEETRKKISESMSKAHKEGRNPGWTIRRKQESYAEGFWKTVLMNNNIPFEQEKRISKSSLGIVGSKHSYFLDFYLIDKNVDLEIDGHQHYEESRKEHDSYRDQKLRDAGYIVYRIKYTNPKNSIVVQEDVERFLDWYNSL